MMKNIASYPGSYPEKMGREPGRSHHVLCDVKGASSRRRQREGMQLPVVHVQTAQCLVLLKLTFPVKHVKNRVRYDYERSMESFPGRWQQQRELLLILVILKKRHPSKERPSLPVRITHQPVKRARFSGSMVGSSSNIRRSQQQLDVC